MRKLWFITGVSSRFGCAIAQAALAAGDDVVGTLRREEERVAFDALQPERSHGVLLDVTDETAVSEKLDLLRTEFDAWKDVTLSTDVTA
jgi:NAD(P)-dependent dehydrogenase (short-subunit alcohol dehydrogenase family)